MTNNRCFFILRGVSGSSSSTEKIFREAFGRIGEIRSFCSEKVPILALSATVDIDFSDIVKACCGLSRNVKLIHSCSDRPNIRLSLIVLKSKSTECFNWLFKLIVENQINCPKVLIYCKSQTLVSWVFGQFETVLGDALFDNKIKNPKNLLVNMFHCDSPEFVKSRCLDSLTNHEIRSPRIVIATSAIGCGINVRGLQYVCHFGLAHSLVDYCQQIGRAGRNGEPDCHAILYTYGASKKGVNMNMKDYADLDGQCLRTKLFSPFSDTNHVPSLIVSHNCCSFCTTSCDCGINHQPLFIFEKENDFSVDTPKVAIRDVSTEDKAAISSLILKYHHDRCTENLHLPSSSETGLTKSLVNDIVDQLEFIDSPAYLMQNVSILEFNLAENIFQLISNFFSNKDKCEIESEFSDIDMDIDTVKKSVTPSEKYVFSDYEDLSDIDVDLDNL